MKYKTPKAAILLGAIDESLADLGTECWDKEVRDQLKKVMDEQTKLKNLLIEEYISGVVNEVANKDIQH